MALRDLVGSTARMNAGFWREVARAVSPEPPPLPPPVAAPADEAASVPEGGMLVPIDTWTRVLDQLANLHQAGQELAEARERAARAETEAAFLREQLATLRTTRRAPPRRRTASAPARPAATTPGGARAAVARVRSRVNTWRLVR